MTTAATDPCIRCLWMADEMPPEVPDDDRQAEGLRRYAIVPAVTAPA